MCYFRISADIYRKLTTEAERMEQEELDIRCLQLIRATIHNEERKLPEDWEEDPQDHKKSVKYLALKRSALWEIYFVINARFLWEN